MILQALSSVLPLILLEFSIAYPPWAAPPSFSLFSLA